MPLLGRRVRLVTFGAVSAASICAAHALAYVVLMPEPAHRASVLHQAGHGYFSWFALGSAFAAAAAVTSLAVQAFSRARRTPNSAASPAACCSTTALAAWQVGAFGAVEIVERLVGGAPLRAAAPVLLVGAALQALIAPVLAGIVGITVRAAHGLARASHVPVPPPRARTSRARRHDTVLPPRLAPTSIAARAPPPLLSS